MAPTIRVRHLAACRTPSRVDTGMGGRLRADRPRLAWASTGIGDDFTPTADRDPTRAVIVFAVAGPR